MKAFIALGIALALSACATTPSYNVCHTDNCGDNVSITVTNEAK